MIALTASRPSKTAADGAASVVLAQRWRLPILNFAFFAKFRVGTLEARTYATACGRQRSSWKRRHENTREL
jgi:hypothetical protein